MNRISVSKSLVDTFYQIMEVEKGYLNRELTSKEISRRTGVKISLLNSYFKEASGLKISQLIAMYRLQHASMLLRKGFPFKTIFKLSGFNSNYELLQTLNDIVK